MWEWFFNYDSCIGDTYGLTNWLNKPEVREALHIHPSVGKFELCQNMTYEEQHDDVYYEVNLPSITENALLYCKSLCKNTAHVSMVRVAWGGGGISDTRKLGNTHTNGKVP